MSLFVLDTDILTLYRKGHASLTRRVHAHSIDELAISVVTVEEHLTGWYTVLRQGKKDADTVRAYQELTNSVQFLGAWPILTLTEPAIIRYRRLQRMKLRVRAADLRIAAIVLEHSGILVTRNSRDFRRVPDLAIEDWTQ